MNEKTARENRLAACEIIVRAGIDAVDIRNALEDLHRKAAPLIATLDDLHEAARAAGEVAYGSPLELSLHDRPDADSLRYSDSANARHRNAIEAANAPFKRDLQTLAPTAPQFRRAVAKRLRREASALARKPKP